jgi:hypothetical protein
MGAAPSANSPVVSYTPGSREFEYGGAGELRVVGPMTGSVYTFSGNGSRVSAQAADVASLALIPGLRLVQ